MKVKAKETYDYYITKGKEYLVITETEEYYKIIDDCGVERYLYKYTFEPIEESNHYDNTNGSLYKFAQERGWNTYVFEVVKRLERAEKKGEFISDLKKSIHVIELYLSEQGHKFKGQIEPLNK